MANAPLVKVQEILRSASRALHPLKIEHRGARLEASMTAAGLKPEAVRSSVFRGTEAADSSCAFHPILHPVSQCEWC